MKTTLAAATALSLFLVPVAFAQQEQHGTQGQENTTWTMPEACQETATGSASPSEMPDQGQSDEADAAQQESAQEQSAGQQDTAMQNADAGMQHGGMAMSGDMPPAMQGYMAAMQEMQQDMPDQPSGDADVDFARMMIPHHQSAIEMAEVVLEHGESDEISSLAEQVITSQRSEIEELCGFLQQHRS